MAQPLYRVVAAVIRQHDRVLLIQQQGPADVTASWALPGGLVEDGELLTEALAREVREETGLQIHTIGPLAYTVHVDNRLEADQLLAFVFEVCEWTGTLYPADTDDIILSADFVPVPTAVQLLQTHWWPVMREPIIAYLSGDIPGGSVWLYRQPVDGEPRALEVVRGAAL